MAWPNESTLIPDILRAAPQVRPIFDRYGLAGCGGPLGPVETIGFFARGHEAPLEALLAELRAAIAQASVPAPQASVSASTADTIYRPFFKAGIAVVLTLGATWGAYLLWRIASRGAFGAAGLHEVNAHGHAQIFGWVGLFVMGFAYQAFPRFKHASLAYPRAAMATLWLLLVGLVGRSVTQVFASESDIAWGVAIAASVCEVTAVAGFVSIIAVTWRRSGKGLAFYDYYILSALAWFVVQAVYESVYLTLTASASGAALTSLVSTWQAPLRDLQIHGFALLMILGVSQRIFHHFYGLPLPDARRSLIALAVLNAAVIGETSGLVLMRTAGHAWAALWYVSVLILGGTAASLVAGWHIFTHAEEGDRSLKFLRAAYVWLFVSLAMLALLPAHQYLLHRFAADSDAARLGFSHAYYGAARHAITVGFVSLMIVGVAAKVVPTLNGVAASRLSSLWAPFLLINAGCSLRVLGQTLTDFSPNAFAVAGVSGLFEVTGLAIWGVQLWRVMSGAYAESEVSLTGAQAQTPDARPIEPSDMVGAVLDRYPELLDTFLSFGFTMLANSQLRHSVARVVSIERACRRMDVDAARFVAALNARRLEVQSPADRLPFVSLDALQAAGTVFANEAGANSASPDSSEHAHSLAHR